MSEPANDQPWNARYRGMRVLQVKRVARVTPLMQRVTLGGDEIRGIFEGPNLKLVFPRGDKGSPIWPMPGEGSKPLMPPGVAAPITRTYSLRRLDRAAGELDIDFVMHGHGVASTWAEHAQPGDLIGIGGPGGIDPRPADWYLLAGDHTALPAISRILEVLPADACGQAFVEIPDRSEEQDLRHPAGVALTWIHRDGEKPGECRRLEAAVRAAPWPDGQRVFAWLAAESTLVRSMRHYVRDERGLGKREFLSIGYWRLGLSEPEYSDKFDHDRGEDFQEALRDEHELRHAEHAH